METLSFLYICVCLAVYYKITDKFTNYFTKRQTKRKKNTQNQAKKTPYTINVHGVLIILYYFTELFVQSQCYVYSTCYSTTYHWVVTNTKEAHHLNVSRN